MCGPQGLPGAGNTVSRELSQKSPWSEAGQDPSHELVGRRQGRSGKKDQLPAFPGHSPGGTAQARHQGH